MGNSTETTIPATTRRDALKAAIKATIREMMADAAAGRTQVPSDTLNPEAALAVYRARLGMMDFLLNPPWITATKPTLDSHELKELDADVDRLLGQVDAAK